ncbi:hypothetical protein [Phenylobacterium soli]|uniref:hypothetical protein n=1 Tax=Phenylobacterium soli TaxID=2170551 RepID=UPI0010582F7E|nr:hypothetical protein [Phenylobacterium soli]
MIGVAMALAAGAAAVSGGETMPAAEVSQLSNCLLGTGQSVQPADCPAPKEAIIRLGQPVPGFQGLVTSITRPQHLAPNGCWAMVQVGGKNVVLISYRNCVARRP